MSTIITILRKLLLPFSLVYGGVVYIRNKFYDWGIFKSQSFDIPVICVGNITVGGTGKTPHTEYLIWLYENSCKLAVLSRGYGRKTKGFRWVNVSDTAETVGDEPLQMKQKFPHITFAVDEKRARGIAKLQKDGYDLVILDDAFQHRAVRPTQSIVLLDYNRLPHKDFYLPTGNLRDGRYALKRTDIVLITKCPDSLSEEEKQRIIAQNRIQTPCFFTTFKYGEIMAFNGKKTLQTLQNSNIVLVTGIANPKPLCEYLEQQGANVKHLAYTDHYHFTEKDVQKIKAEWEQLSKDTILLTTEKDKVKLQPLLETVPDLFVRSFYIPITVTFQDEKASDFTKCLGLKF